eukprot:1187919-Prymnesium_polylepis.1
MYRGYVDPSAARGIRKVESLQSPLKSRIASGSPGPVSPPVLNGAKRPPYAVAAATIPECTPLGKVRGALAV